MDFIDCSFSELIATDMPLDLNAGELTQWAILEREGALITWKPDYLIVRTPQRANYYSGNFLHILTESIDDIQSWIDIFHREFPQAHHITLQIPHRPESDFYSAYGLELETTIVLIAEELPLKTPLTAGYTVRSLETEEDWEQYFQQGMKDNADDESYESETYAAYLRDAIAVDREQCAMGKANFFGAFHSDGTLVSSLGIMLLGNRARYQSIGTSVEHRRKGLAGHLIYMAAHWTFKHGVTSWIIITGETNSAASLYRKLGFQEIAQIFELHKVPEYQPPLTNSASFTNDLKISSQMPEQ